jgi:Peptidase family M49.
MRFLSRSVLILAALIQGAAFASTESLPDIERLRQMHARFVPVELAADISHLPANERTALARMVDAARILDAVFLRQVSPLNEAQLAALVRDSSPLGRARLNYFRLNAGPWSRLDHDTPFLPGVGPKPPGANFYPADATREEIDAWLNSLTGDEHAAATGFFTVIRRTPDRRLTAVPYSLEYQNELVHAARLLREAADATTQPTLKAFLEKRAAAFLNNDYYDSDVAWMELDASIEPTIGPYEVYEDEWFNFKAAFEAFITVTDQAETAKLARFSEHLQELENNLPLDPRYRRSQLGGYSPIRVVNLVFSSGDANRGVQTAAFNLPNDERVVAEKGSKRVMLKNTQEAKFAHVLVPISKRVLAPADQPHVAFDPFFTHILMHELMHGLGPQTIEVDGRQTTVRAELRELNGRLEEAKADVSGLWALQFLMDAGVIDKAQERAMYTTFLASTFRTLRFGVSSAHAQGMALQFNWHLDSGAVTANPDGTFAFDLEKLKSSVVSLTREILTIQAKGDYTGAKNLLDRMVVIRPEVQRALERLTDLPVDIEPNFTTAQSL